MSSVAGFFSSARKSLVTAVGFAVTVLTAYHAIPVLPDQPFVVAVLGVLTTVATYLTPNGTA